jgi:hypothetical protein
MNLSVEGGKDINQNNVEFDKESNSLSQRWEVIYLDEEKVKITDAQVASFKTKFEKVAQVVVTKSVLKIATMPDKVEDNKTEKTSAPKPKLFF